MIVYLRDHDGNDVIAPSSLSIVPVGYQSQAQGGPAWAEIRVEGDTVSLWSVLTWLAYRIEIQADDGSPYWWGQVDEVSLSFGPVTIGVSLASVANALAVIWSQDGEGGVTDFATDTDSINRYGRRELILSVDGVDLTGAEQRRDWEIARRKLPSPSIGPGLTGKQSATLNCVGYFGTMGNTYYARDEGLVEYATGNGVAQKLGWGFTSTELGFTERGKVVSEGNGYIGELSAGESFRVTGSSSNNSTFVVEQGTQQEADSLTAATIAFLSEQRRTNGEYLRASHDVERNLRNFNLFAATTALSTLSATSGVNGTHDGSSDSATLTDSGASWTTDQWAGRRIINVTDGSEGTIKSNTATTITVSLYGGQDNDWDSGDEYIISHDEIWMADVSVIQSGDRIRVELDGGGYFQTFVRGTPDPVTGRVLLQDSLSGQVSSTNDVDRINRWVTDDGGSTFYAEGTDYTIDATYGTITVDSGGSIANNSVMRVSYIYTEYRIEDSDLGLAFVAAGDMIEIAGSGANDQWYRVISTSSEGDRITVREDVSNEAPGNSITVTRGNNLTLTSAPADELPGSSSTVRAYGWMAAQSFTVPSDNDWDFYTVQIMVNRVGDPSDNLRVAIYTDSSGPGSSVESATVVGSGLSTSRAWVSFSFGGTNTLTAGDTFWIVIDRTGSADPADYYEVAIDEDQSYTGGALKVHDGTAWQDRPGGGDMPFRILGKEETTTQIEVLIAQESEYLAGVDTIDTSSVEYNQYRDGKATALSELLDLLEAGTSNDVRLLGTVTRDLVLKVEEEPTQPDEPDYQLGVDGYIYTKFGQRLPLGTLEFVGQWLAFYQYPPSIDWEALGAPTPFLVESAEFDAQAQTYRIQPANVAPVWRIGMSIDEG